MPHVEADRGPQPHPDSLAAPRARRDADLELPVQHDIVAWFWLAVVRLLRVSLPLILWRLEKNNPKVDNVDMERGRPACLWIARRRVAARAGTCTRTRLAGLGREVTEHGESVQLERTELSRSKGDICVVGAVSQSIRPVSTSFGSSELTLSTTTGVEHVIQFGPSRLPPPWADALHPPMLRCRRHLLWRNRCCCCLGPAGEASNPRRREVSTVGETVVTGIRSG